MPIRCKDCSAFWIKKKGEFILPDPYNSDILSDKQFQKKDIFECLDYPKRKVRPNKHICKEFNPKKEVK